MEDWSLEKPLLGTKNTINYQTDSSEIQHPRVDVDLNQSRIQRQRLLGIVLSALTVISNVSMVVTLPLFSLSLDGHSDPYFLLFSSGMWFPVVFWIPLSLGIIYKNVNPMLNIRDQMFLMIVGVLNAFNGLFVVYASNPNRTPAYLQAILSTSVIPFTVFFRYVILRKGISKERLICTFAVLIGLLISLEPNIFNMNAPKKADDQENQLSSSASNVGSILWPICFLLGFVPIGILNVILEKQLKGQDSHSLTAVAWIQIYNFATIALLFWTDFIPGFGTAKNFSEFWHLFSSGYKCQYGVDETCQSVVLRSWLFIMAYCCANLLNLVLIKFSSSSVYLVIVQAITTPVGAIFLKLFKFSRNTFEWNPVFNESMVYVIVGLLIIVPAVVIYNILGERERQHDTNNRDNKK